MGLTIEETVNSVLTITSTPSVLELENNPEAVIDITASPTSTVVEVYQGLRGPKGDPGEGGGTGGAVDSVNGETGAVVLTSSDIGAATSAQGAKADSAVQPEALSSVAFSGDYADLINKPVIEGGGASSWDELTDKPTEFPPSAHAHVSSDISDSTATGRTLLTSATAADARTAIGAGTSSLVIGTTASDAKAGNYVPSWSEITSKPSSFTPSTHSHTSSEVTDFTSAVQSIVNTQLEIASSPATLDTINELAQALGDDANFATTVTNSLAAKAPLASPTFTGTVSGVSKAMVGLGNVDNTSDANKPVSTATQTALSGKANTSHSHSAANITSGTLDAARLTAGTTLTVVKSGGTWPARPTSRADVVVIWKGADPSPAIVSSGTSGMLDNVDMRFVTA